MRIEKELYQNLILSQKEIQLLIDELSENFDYNATLDLIEELKEKFPVPEEKKKEFPRKYFVPWLCRAMYIAGFLHAVEQRNEKIKKLISFL